MFVEIVHTNGRYDPDAQQHTLPMGMSELIPEIQQATEDVIASGGDVLYKMNLNGNLYPVASDPGKLAAAIAADPLLSGLSESARKSLIIRPDGRMPTLTQHDLTDPAGVKDYETHREWSFDNLLGTRQIEDSLIRKHYQGFVVGAFTTACVLATAKNIKARNPSALIYVDEQLSVDVPGRRIDVGQNGNIALSSLRYVLLRPEWRLDR